MAKHKRATKRPTKREAPKLRRILIAKGLDPEAIDIARELRRKAIGRGADQLPENAVHALSLFFTFAPLGW